MERIPAVYAKAAVGENAPSQAATKNRDPNCLATLKHYRSLMPLAQEAHVRAQARRRRDRGTCGGRAVVLPRLPESRRGGCGAGGDWGAAPMRATSTTRPCFGTFTMPTRGCRRRCTGIGRHSGRKPPRRCHLGRYGAPRATRPVGLRKDMHPPPQPCVTATSVPTVSPTPPSTTSSFAGNGGIGPSCGMRHGGTGPCWIGSSGSAPNMPGIR